MKNTGSCLCGKISFSVDNLLPSIAHCHCKMCQKFHGAAFSTFVEVKVSDLHWLRGKELLKSFQAENKTVRKFCQNCGSSLIFESKYNRKASTIEIALAAFDTKVDAKPDAHIFTQSKVEWIEITDNISQHLAFRE